MTYAESLLDYLSKNKRILQVYLVLSAFFSVFLFYSSKGTLSVNAEDISLYGTSVIGGTLSSSLIIFAMNANISLAPPIALSFTAILSIINGFVHFEQLENFSFGLLDMWVFRIFVFVWALISVIPRCFQVSHTVGVVLEEIDSKCGLIATIIIPISQVFGNFGSNELINAAPVEATTTSVVGTVVVSGFVLIPICFMYLLALLTCYIFVNTFVYFIDIILVPLCSFIPFMSPIVEIVKAAITFVLVLLAVFAPEVYLVLYGILLIISIIFFKKAYVAGKYFENIYLKPLIRRIFGYKQDIDIVHKKAPKKILADLNTENIEILLPVYAVKKIKDKKVKNHEKWWFIMCDGKCYIRKPIAFRKKFRDIPLVSTPDKKVFIKKSFRFFEIFTLESEANLGHLFRNVKKDLHFVYSKEYFFKFDTIKDLTGFVDYTVYKLAITNSIKLSRQEARELKRMERLELAEERRMQKYLSDQINMLQ